MGSDIPQNEARCARFADGFRPSVAESRTREGREIYATITPSVETWVNRGLEVARRWVKLHGVGLDTSQGGQVRRKQAVGNLGQAGIGEVLHH